MSDEERYQWVMSIPSIRDLSSKQFEAILWFLNLSSEERSAQIVFRYEDYFNDQQKELEVVSGYYKT